MRMQLLSSGAVWRGSLLPHGVPGRLLTILLLLASPVALAGSAKSGWDTGSYHDTPGQGRPAVATRAVGPVLDLGDTAVQRPRVRPGGSAALRAEYSVSAPSGGVQVKETRIIRYDGVVLSRLERVVSRRDGTVQSEYRMTVPGDAAEGWYSVTTMVEPVRPTTRSGDVPQRDTGFYVDPKAGNAAPTPAPPAAGTGAPAPADEQMTITLRAPQTRYKIGDKLTLQFQTNRDAYVTLVNVGTSGEVTILFPNRFSGGHGVKGGKTYSIPEPGDAYELAVSGPLGVELIYALVTSKPVVFLPTDFSRTARVFHSVDKAESFTRDINAVAKAIPLKEQAKAVIELEVVQ